jgi:hypothetical protein
MQLSVLLSYAQCLSTLVQSYITLSYLSPNRATGTVEPPSRGEAVSIVSGELIVISCNSYSSPRYSRLGYSPISVLVGFFARTNVH